RGGVLQIGRRELLGAFEFGQHLAVEVESGPHRAHLKPIIDDDTVGRQVDDDRAVVVVLRHRMREGGGCGEQEQEQTGPLHRNYPEENSRNTGDTETQRKQEKALKEGEEAKLSTCLLSSPVFSGSLCLLWSGLLLLLRLGDRQRHQGVA